ncbi:hypothetical protein OG780_19365 [Streptomyces sp. NBC_00386]|uniref:hypothetical protein n=1 Tax=Streptomyces sp. NBC_00386 TaxID=2975734 RepID=UPI002E1D6E53
MRLRPRRDRRPRPTENSISVQGLTAQYPLPCRVSKGGALIACPECAAADDLVLSVDGDDRSESASFVRCPDGHLWAEPLISRRVGVELLESYVAAGKHL